MFQPPTYSKNSQLDEESKIDSVKTEEVEKTRKEVIDKMMGLTPDQVMLLNDLLNVVLEQTSSTKEASEAITSVTKSVATLSSFN